MEASLKGLGGLLDGLGPRKVANMAPSWPPKRSQNQLKIDPKIDQFFSASWNGFWKDFGGFWMPKYSQVELKMGSKFDVNFERRVFKKVYFSCGKTMFFEIQWVEVGSKNRSKIDLKLQFKMECNLASNFKRF